MLRNGKMSGNLSVTVLAAFGLSLVLAGCRPAPPTDQQIKDQAAEATRQVRQGAKEAAADAKVAAANAARTVNDIAAGVKEGAGLPSSSHKTLNINSASVDQLASLPGISGAKARKILDKRPYLTAHGLVSKGLISEKEYRRIEVRVSAY